MSILSIILLTLLVIVGLIILLILVLLIKIKISARKHGFDSLISLYKDIRQSSHESFNDVKSIGSQTQLLLPKISRDFPNFSENEIFNKTEASLRAIFNSLESKKISDKDDIVLMKENLKEEIEDMISNNTNVRYDNVKFHKHGIKSYRREKGVATIVVNTALEYDYEKTIDGKIVDNNFGYKKQDKMVSKFIYVYDPDNYSKAQTLIGITCPNCGAPVKELGNKVCRYCGSGLEDINLKSWHMVSYKSDI